jgi:pyruvate/2-oxoglutarate dehydrogenase complex dihydrolipoamide acyltransferase (E2) component
MENFSLMDHLNDFFGLYKSVGLHGGALSAEDQANVSSGNFLAIFNRYYKSAPGTPILQLELRDAMVAQFKAAQNDLVNAALTYIQGEGKQEPAAITNSNEPTLANAPTGAATPFNKYWFVLAFAKTPAVVVPAGAADAAAEAAARAAEAAARAAAEKAAAEKAAAEKAAAEKAAAEKAAAEAAAAAAAAAASNQNFVTKFREFKRDVVITNEDIDLSFNGKRDGLVSLQGTIKGIFESNPAKYKVVALGVKTQLQGLEQTKKCLAIITFLSAFN